MAASVVLSTLDKPTIALVIPPTVPVKVGEARLAFKSKAVCCAVLTGLFTSLVLSTLDKPTKLLSITELTQAVPFHFNKSLVCLFETVILDKPSRL